MSAFLGLSLAALFYIKHPADVFCPRDDDERDSIMLRSVETKAASPCPRNMLGQKKAIVAVFRKLLMLIYPLL